MRKIKYIIITLGLSAVVTILIIIVLRKPNYSINTSGKLVIVNKLSSSIIIFNLKNGKTISEIPVEIEPHEVITLLNQKQFAITNYGAPDVVGESISVVNANTSQIEKTIDLKNSPRPHGITRVPNSDNVVVVTDIGNELLVVNTQTGYIEKRISTEQELSHMVVLHPYESLAYVTNINSGSVSVIDLELGKLIQIISCGLGTEGIDITPDGKEVWVSNSRENTISVINTETNEVIDTLTTGNEAMRLKFSIDGKYCFVPNSKDGVIRVYNQKTKEQIEVIEIPGKKNLVDRLLYHTPRPVGILMHPNGKYIFVANSNADKVEVIDIQTFEIVCNIGTGRVPDGLAFIK